MDMVGHETPRPDSNPMRPTPIFKDRQLPAMIIILKQGLRPPIAPLGHMERQAGDDSSGKSSHVEKPRLNQDAYLVERHRNHVIINQIF